MKKRKLSEVYDGKVFSFPEAVAALHWTMHEHEDNTTTCDCDCGNDKLDYSGFIGTENIVCPVCGKRMTDIFSPIPVSNSSCMILDPNEFEIEKDDDGNDRFWIAFDGEKQL